MDARVRSALEQLQQHLRVTYGPRLDRLLVFGSQARGDSRVDSDVDVLVVLHGEVYPGEEIRRTGAIVANLSLQNDLVISPVFVSTERFLKEESPLLLNVRCEGVPL